MTNQINIFLLSFGALQGAILSFWIFRKQPRQLSNLYFSLLIITVGLQLTFKVVTKTWLMQFVYFPYVLSYGLPFLIGPLLFLYSTSRKNKIFRPLDLLHFIPFALYIFATLASIPYDEFYVRPVFQIASLTLYGYLSFRNVDHSLRQFIIVVIIIEVIITVTLSLSQIYYGRIFDLRLLFILLTLLIYWVSYSMLSKPDEFLETGSKPLFSLGSIKKPKYAHSSLSTEEAERIESEVTRLMLHEKIFLDAGLTIDSFATKINTSRHHLSQVVNERLQKSYVDLIVDARLNEAKKRLCDPINLRFTIAAIALDSGFNSISSFNDVFKKRYGMTPSRFRDQNLNKMSA